MIVDTVENLAKYQSLNENITKCIDFLQKTDAHALTAGRYDLDGETLFYFVNEYDTTEGGRFEAHKTYLDLQYVFQGRERIDYAPLNDCSLTDEYNEKKDVLFGTAENYTPVKLKEGTFALLFPQDMHRPGKIDGEVVAVKKLVFKLKI